MSVDPPQAKSGGHANAKLRLALAGRDVLERGDQLLATVAPKDPPGLLVFIFHTLFADQAEIDRGLLDPHERATPKRLERLVDHFRAAGYDFVSAAGIDAGLAPGRRYAHLTFDDGFANNLALVELLPRIGAYATVFPSINHVVEQRAFWWNVLYRELHGRGRLADLPADTARLRRLTDAEVDRDLRERFGGAEALRPRGDADRPLTVAELRELAASPHVEIGNHTLDHAVLTNYAPAEAEAQVAGAQRWLDEELGVAPTFIAYPNGSFNDGIVAMAERNGLRLGVTVAAGRNEVPPGPAERMRLSRFRIVFDDRAEQRMRAVRSRVQLTALARRLAVD
jgi:peptidoglycan/xylan/chitin deacetylase (PgdA/CDA1 family)